MGNLFSEHSLGPLHKIIEAAEGKFNFQPFHAEIFQLGAPAAYLKHRKHIVNKIFSCFFSFL
jgi:hypothetical protein